MDNGEYRLLSPQLIRTGKQGDIVLWSAADALVMKWVALEIKNLLPQQNVIKQYIWYTVEYGGEFFTPQGGICRASALNPLLGASFLWYVDSAFSRQEDIYYVPYMDDFLFLSTRRWPLRRVVRRLHDYFEDTCFECHPGKTQVGRTERGFDWLGIWFDATGSTGIAHRAKENYRASRLRLEEQARRRGLSEEAVRQRVQQYEARWILWAERQLKSSLLVTLKS